MMSGSIPLSWLMIVFLIMGLVLGYLKNVLLIQTANTTPKEGKVMIQNTLKSTILSIIELAQMLTINLLSSGLTSSPS